MKKKEPIRVAQIMGKLWAGGVEAVVFNYYRQLDKSLIQFDFYYDADSTVEPPHELVEMGAHFIKVPPYQHLIKYLKALRKYFKINNYVIIHSHINTLSVFPLFMAWYCKIPVRIAHNHSVPGGKQIKRNILKAILKKLSKLFPTDYSSCSEKAGRWMFGNRAFDVGKVKVVKNAVDFKRFNTDRNILIEKRRMLDLENSIVIGIVGRFTYAKNHLFLLDIVNKIAEQRKDIALLLVGDGEMRPEILKKVNDLGLSQKVKFMGQVSDPENYYGLTDVIVVPSVFEGLSLTTIESQIAGVPVVISEAVPDEAIISNACHRMKLSDSIDDWADTIVEATKEQVVLNGKSKDYDIVYQASDLSEWYLNKYEKVSKLRRA